MSSLVVETLLIGLGTYLLRALSLALGGRAPWPDGVRRWLSFVTPGVLGALLGPVLFLSGDGKVALDLANPALIAAVPTALFAWWSRRLFPTVVLGVLCYTAAIYWL
ncbi:AzlD domain-containing protein [Kyrpidia sp.]|uniref:AzlD domain-containing protein n=1 Tax=Kyrpidia sp. TaxID=2073077 RepID=UPI001813E82F|nr:AzlD domain-containing protein [Kyrpidia sp.]MCL6575298.1 AzlD domain-containing protein [Kyrpidia sp.]HHY68052.1 AzlD domain-containing protein [Alicyclobacillus sp.]